MEKQETKNSIKLLQMMWSNFSTLPKVRKLNSSAQGQLTLQEERFKITLIVPIINSTKLFHAQTQIGIR